ncbi:MAG: DegT/DnrJ/EryC1/StrS family aminotransferase [Congregibacter sp.]
MMRVTKPYLPSREKLDEYLNGIYEREWLTNNGELVQELTRRLQAYLGVENLLLVANGTLALQVAYRALGVGQTTATIQPEAVTSPFTFIATASALKWDGVQPVFADIDPNTWCLSPAKVEAAVNENTQAIVPVHVFGNACDVEAIGAIARKHNLKVIYDASHAFGTIYKGESLLKHGDAATLSFHATKLFHTGEGGAIIFKRREDLERATKMINFGITGPETIEELGINAKMNELQAAMGLCVLDEMGENLSGRAAVWHGYEHALNQSAQFQTKPADLRYNYAYFPMVFESEEQVLRVALHLKKNGILARRYFYPSLDSLELFAGCDHCRISRSIASRILCLPLYYDLQLEESKLIINKVKEAL